MWRVGILSSSTVCSINDVRRPKRNLQCTTLFQDSVALQKDKTQHFHTEWDEDILPSIPPLKCNAPVLVFFLNVNIATNLYVGHNIILIMIIGLEITR